MTEVSIIIVNFNGCEQTMRCIESIQRTHEKSCFEVIVVDNDSRDGSVEAIKAQYPNVNVLAQQQNLGFGKANNIGAMESTGEFLFFVNNDTIFKDDLITPLSRFLKENSSCGAVGPLLLNADGTYQHSYGYFPSLLNEWRVQRETQQRKTIPINRAPKIVDWVSFAAVMIRRSEFNKIGGFDENYFMYFEDADLCFRLMKAGYSTFYCPEYSLIHVRGGSRSHADLDKIKLEYRRSQIYFYKLHRPSYETIALRIYLIGKYLLYCIYKSGKEHRSALLIIKMILYFHAHRS